MFCQFLQVTTNLTRNVQIVQNFCFVQQSALQVQQIFRSYNKRSERTKFELDKNSESDKELYKAKYDGVELLGGFFLTLCLFSFLTVFNFYNFLNPL